LKSFFIFGTHQQTKQSGSSGRRGLKAGTKTETVRRRLCVKADEVIEADFDSPSGKGKAGKSGSRRRERQLSGKGKGGSKGSDGMFGRANDECLCIEAEIGTRAPDDDSPSGKGKAGKSGSRGDMDTRVDINADTSSGKGKAGKSGSRLRERELSGKGKGGKVSSGTVFNVLLPVLVSCLDHIHGLSPGMHFSSINQSSKLSCAGIIGDDYRRPCRW
jgi:hypothetical protein